VPEAGRGFLGETGLRLHRDRRDWGGQLSLVRRGEVYGIHLAYSGNHRLVAEKLVQGGRHIQASEWLYPGEISLAEGEHYATPWVYGSWSGEGLNAMSQQFHRFLRRRLQLDVQAQPRPVHLNTWEAMYFDHQPQRLLEPSGLAASVGVERFVLDDGWFIGRNDDHAGLGDWYVDETKHPGGLDYLVDAVHAGGMQFGLWFEPEMINQNSNLFRQHPDWILQLEGYNQPLGRNQYVLDLANPAVFDYLYERLDHFLGRYAIDYIKWDMNRDLTQPGHQGIASVHAQTQALYRLLGAIRQAHPAVEIETCASGGGRADFEVLRHCQRIWVSDCIDALERQRIQYGYSLFLPPQIMDSHISESRTHTTGRQHSLSFRLITALFGHMGLELDLARLSDSERADVSGMLALYKRHRTLLHSGDFQRLDVADPSLNAYGVVSAERGEALFAVASLAMPATIQRPRPRLCGIDPQRCYRVLVQVAQEALTNQVAPSEFYRRQEADFSGELLLQLGLPLPLLHPESAFLIHLQAR
jgi:alpha-galactosidase